MGGGLGSAMVSNSATSGGAKGSSVREYANDPDALRDATLGLRANNTSWPSRQVPPTASTAPGPPPLRAARDFGGVGLKPAQRLPVPQVSGVPIVPTTPPSRAGGVAT